MTSESNQSTEASIFQPVEPEPVPPVEASPAGPATPSRRTRTLVNGVLAVALVVLVGGVGFAAGRATVPAATTAGENGGGNSLPDGGLRPGDVNGQFPGNPRDIDPRGRFETDFGGLSIQGTVTAVDGDSISIEVANGGSVEIAIDSDTDYHRRADASASDVTAGTTVIVGVNGMLGVAGAGTSASDITIVP